MNQRLIALFAVAALTGATATTIVAAGTGARPDTGGITTVPAQVRSGTYALDPAHSKITWAVSHLGFSTYIGQFAAASGTLTIDPARPQATKLEASVAIDSVGTLNPALDTHLKSADFFDAVRFPTATFAATQVRMTGKRTADIAGTLTMRGVARPVVVHATFNQAGINPVDKGYRIGFDGTATIRRSAFGINYALPVLGDTVDLRIEAEFKPAA